MSNAIRSLVVGTHFVYKLMVALVVSVATSLATLVRWASPRTVRIVREYGPPASRKSLAISVGVARALGRTIWFIIRRYKVTTVSFAVLLLAAWGRSKGVVEAEVYWSHVMRGFIVAMIFNSILTLFSERAAVKRLLHPAHDAMLDHPRLGVHYERVAYAAASQWEESQRKFPEHDSQAYESLMNEVNMAVSPSEKGRIQRILTPGNPKRFFGQVHVLSEGESRVERSAVEQVGIPGLHAFCVALDAAGHFVAAMHLPEGLRDGYYKRVAANEHGLHLPAPTTTEWSALAEAAEEILRQGQ